MAFFHSWTAKIKAIGLYLSKPHVIFYSLPWLMVLLVLGTISQKELGLYRAVEIFINSWILWIGPIPTPGGLTTLGIIFLALLIKFIFYSPWSWQKSGTILTHLGVLLLLIGGILTAITNKEGFVIIPEGETVETFSDYRERVLVFKIDDEIIREIDFNTLTKGTNLSQDGYAFRILIRCDNCGVRAPTGKYENLSGLAENMELYVLPNEKNIEANFSGLIFQAKQADYKDFKTYIVMEDINKSPEFKTNDGILRLSIERQKTPLPFAVRLKDFRKIDYPGTKKAKEFESDLIIQDGDLEWPTTISMNKPLRYKGYSFFQSSFDQIDGQEITVLNVVKNAGQIFPYISTLIIFAGLLLHLILRLMIKTKQRDLS
jgi:hypothetical protein